MNQNPDRESQITDTLINQRQSRQQQIIKQQQPLKPQPQQKIRIKSIDIYRGMTMVGMIIVDNMGPSKNPPVWLDHPPWDGLTVADFIFPAFLFIMGMAVPLAISEKRPAKIRNYVRVAGLFLIGFMLNLIARKFDFETVRVMGILQRLAICYGLILSFHVLTGYGNNRKRFIGFIMIIILYVIYLSLMISFDGGDIQGCSRQNNLTNACNICGYIDRKILTPAHMLKNTKTDPQGLFSTIGALITTYMGYEYSMIMSKFKSNPKILIKYWLSIAAIIGAAVYPMSLLFPFNKHTYTPSFILVVGSVSGAALTFFYILVDIIPQGKPKTQKIISTITAPFLWLGMNPLAIFVLMDLLAIFFILYIKIDGKSLWTQFFNHVFGSWISDDAVSAIVFACFFVILWTAVAGLMHRFKIYVRL